MPFQRILFPTDFSELSKAAIPHLLELLQKHDATVHVIHVLEAVWGPADTTWSMGGIDDVEEKRTSYAHDRLGVLVQELGIDENRCEIAVERGSAYQTIADYAKRNSIDLIIMATHGRTGLSHLLIGSTAERVVRLAPCPVMTVKAVAGEET